MQRNDFKILIAEDDPGARKLYEKTFRQEGYEVVLVASGSEMMAELDEQRFDLLITDLKLDGMSALEVLPHIRQRNSNMPIIVVSGYYVNLLEEFHQKGFNVDLFLHKPLGLSDLKAAVRRILGLPLEETSRGGAAS
ncbi:MAG TPA: response regulator [bacterium]|nr:response regulator [bacterium]